MNIPALVAIPIRLIFITGVIAYFGILLVYCGIRSFIDLVLDN